MPEEAMPLTRLFPSPNASCPLSGLFLSHDLRGRGTPGRPFVYTNFISTLDGRISWKNPHGYREVPPASANRHDLRLYHELAAQADVVVTTARHLHAVAAGRAAGTLPYGEWTDELTTWRKQRGLRALPRVAAISGSLRLPDRGHLAKELGEIMILTWGAENGEARRKAGSQGYRVLACGPESEVDGNVLLDTLVDTVGDECRTVYSIAGPRLHGALLRADRLDRLYLTIVQLLLGGDEFDTLTRGPYLSPPPAFSLAELYHDSAEPAGKGQLFAVFERR